MDSALLENLRSIPKADLHVHLEGCVDPPLLRALAAKNGIALDRPVTLSGNRAILPPLPSHCTSGFRSGDFREFIRLYVKISECLRDSSDFVAVLRSYARQAAAEGIVAAEMYVTPTTLLSLNVRETELLRGLKDAESAAREESGLRLRWIFDIVRNSPLPGERTIEHAIAARKAGVSVTAIGLAGLERGYPAAPFANALRLAREEGFSVVIHAGETAPSESVRDAIESGPPARIGHGVTAADDETVLDELRRRAITLELCPASNLALGVLTPESRAMELIARSGVPFVIGSDDPGIFGASLLENYSLAAGMGVPPDLLLAAAARSRALFGADYQSIRTS